MPCSTGKLPTKGRSQKDLWFIMFFLPLSLPLLLQLPSTLVHTVPPVHPTTGVVYLFPKNQLHHSVCYSVLIHSPHMIIHSSSPILSHHKSHPLPSRPSHTFHTIPHFSVYPQFRPLCFIPFSHFTLTTPLDPPTSLFLCTILSLMSFFLTSILVQQWPYIT